MIYANEVYGRYWDSVILHFSQRLGSRMLTWMVTCSHTSPQSRHLRSSLSSLISAVLSHRVSPDASLWPNRNGHRAFWPVSAGSLRLRDTSQRALACQGFIGVMDDGLRRWAQNRWLSPLHEQIWHGPFLCVNNAAISCSRAVHGRNAAHTSVIFHSRELSAPSVVGLIDELIIREVWGRNVKTHGLPRFLMRDFSQSDEWWITYNISDRIYKTQRCSLLRSLEAAPADSLCSDWPPSEFTHSMLAFQTKWTVILQDSFLCVKGLSKYASCQITARLWHEHTNMSVTMATGGIPGCVKKGAFQCSLCASLVPDTHENKLQMSDEFRKKEKWCCVYFTLAPVFTPWT